jgi:hypothetical protein
MDVEERWKETEMEDVHVLFEEWNRLVSSFGVRSSKSTSALQPGVIM